MTSVQIFWDPQGFELNSLGSNKLIGATDGDTPSVSINIRMLSIDTPEIHYPGNQNPAKNDAILAQLGQWIQDGHAPIEPGLGNYLYPKLATGKAGTLQANQGKAAKVFFETLLKEKLQSANGSWRQVFLRVSSQPFDNYGRILAYMSPSYSALELASMTRKERATFNLLLIESGWAAPFLIYPSLLRYDDLLLFHECAEEAFKHGKGVWGDPLTLTGYEYRMCIKLFEVTKKIISGKTLSSKERKSWISRYCVDMTTRMFVFPEDYYQVKPYNRIFIWPQDVMEAVGKLNLNLGKI